MTRSLFSALAGWLVCFVLFAVLYLLDGGWPSLLSVAPFLALVSGGVIFLVWLCLLWPLYRLVPLASPLWRPAVCTGCGAAAGAVILWLFFGVALNDWTARAFWLWPYLCIGAAAGAVTCAVGSVLKRSDRPRFKAEADHEAASDHRA